MITEDQLEQQCLGWFRESGWETVFGPSSALGAPTCIDQSRILAALRDPLLNVGQA